MWCGMVSHVRATEWSDRRAEISSNHVCREQQGANTQGIINAEIISAPPDDHPTNLPTARLGLAASSIQPRVSFAWICSRTVDPSLASYRFHASSAGPRLLCLTLTRVRPSPFSKARLLYTCLMKPFAWILKPRKTTQFLGNKKYNSALDRHMRPVSQNT